jgi:hypothetical protein
LVLTTGSSWVIPIGVTSIKVWAIGGGGGGAGAPTNDSTSGGGGGAGGCAVKTYSVSAGQTLTYSIGASGTSGYDTGGGGNGGNTSATYAGTTILAYGGTGGYYNSSSDASGGTATGGDVNATGGIGNSATGDTGGGGGGAINGVPGGDPSSSGGTGGQSTDISGLSTALTYTGGVPIYQTKLLKLNLTNAGVDATEFSSNLTQFSVSGSLSTSGNNYVAYLFAHDTGADGLIQCGSFTLTSADIEVTLGWEPQYLLSKPVSLIEGWDVLDSSRGFASGYAAAGRLDLQPNTSASDNGRAIAGITATGFVVPILGYYPPGTYLYMAIRRGPMKKPTVGTQVYNAIAYSGNDFDGRKLTGLGFTPDYVAFKQRTVPWVYNSMADRLRGFTVSFNYFATGPQQEETIAPLLGFGMDGVTLGAGPVYSRANDAPATYIAHFFKRYPGVFDVVCYTGNAVANRQLTHNLRAVPELVISKSRTLSSNWYVYHTLTGLDKWSALDSAGAVATTSAVWGSTAYTTTTISLGQYNSNASGHTHVAYLFATLAGISKVGSYTGNGSSQTINAGFTTGARFILIKRTDSTGPWFIWDTTRGVIAGNDPHLALNTTAAEVATDDSIDPDNSGFIVNQYAATNINVTSATYIYLAFA